MMREVACWTRPMLGINVSSKVLDLLTLWAVLTAEDARDSSGDMGCGVLFMIARKSE